MKDAMVVSSTLSIITTILLLPLHSECFNCNGNKGIGYRHRKITKDGKYKLSSSIQTNDGSSSSGMSSSNNDGDTIEWLRRQGGSSNGVSISVSSSSGGFLRGLVASCDAQAGDVLLNVPLDACLCSSEVKKNSKETAPAALVSQSFNAKKENNKVLLALRVLEERRQQKESPFLDSWPECVNGLPENIMDDEDLLQKSQCKLMVADTKRYRAWVEENYYNHFSGDAPLLSRSINSPRVTLEEFRTTMQLVGSRCIERIDSGSGSGSSSILVPVLDMANHDGANPTAFHRLIHQENDKGVDLQPTISSIQLVAKRPLQIGDDVTISYGDYCNRIMVGCYGFVPNNNPDDYELVSLIEVLQAARDAECRILEGWCNNNNSAEDLFSIVERVETSMGLSVENFRFSARTGPDENFWLALRAASLLIKEDDEQAADLLEIIEAISMDEADEEDLWFESDTDRDAAERAQVVSDACRVLEQTIGGSRYTAIDEDEKILATPTSSSPDLCGQKQHEDDAANTSGSGQQCDSSSREVLVRLRLERKKLFVAIGQEMETILRQPDRARESIVKLLQLS